MYWDEIADEIEKRVLDDLAKEYRPGEDTVTATWKRHIVDVIFEKSKMLRLLGAAQRKRK